MLLLYPISSGMLCFHFNFCQIFKNFLFNFFFDPLIVQKCVNSYLFVTFSTFFLLLISQFSSVVIVVPDSCDPMDCSTPDFPVHHQLPELTQAHVHRVSDTIQPSRPLSPLLLLPSIFPSTRIFSNASVLRIRWPKYWSFSFSISPSNEYSGLISFRMDWFDLLAVQGTF